MTSFAPCGLVVGHATDAAGATGCTVVRGEGAPFRCGVHVLGRATGTRELALLEPGHLVDRVDAIFLSGGSAYGLDAAAGVMRWMEERGRGFPVGGGVVPIVPAAVIFDLAPCGRFDRRPTPEMAYAACEHATTTDIAEGSVGAGTGATVGKSAGPLRAMKGGVGCAIARGGSHAVFALAVVNALGDVRDASGRIIAGARDERGRFLDAERTLVGPGWGAAPPEPAAMQNTTIALVASTAALSRVQLAQLAQAAGAAFFRRITPAGTSFDGDIIFAISPLAGQEAPALQVEALAVRALEEAVERGVRLARGCAGVPGVADLAADAAPPPAG